MLSLHLFSVAAVLRSVVPRGAVSLPPSLNFGRPSGSQYVALGF
jgi:hypothetical protein